MQALRDWVEESPYARSLGVVLETVDESEVRLRLPYQDANSNPGKALHGGCAASLGVIGGQAVARHVLGTESGPWHTANLQVGYLSAALGEDVVAQARLLRRGKELCFVQVSVETLAGKPIATCSSVVRGRGGAPPPALRVASGDAGGCEPGPLGTQMGKLPFIGSRGIVVEHMQEGRSRLVMSGAGANADLSGSTHEGAVVALLDTAGACAAWAESGVGPYKASTAAIQAQLLGETPGTDLVAHARCAQRDAEIFFSDVEIADAASGEVSARGTVLYRIVV